MIPGEHPLRFAAVQFQDLTERERASMNSAAYAGSASGDHQFTKSTDRIVVRPRTLDEIRADRPDRIVVRPKSKH